MTPTKTFSVVESLVMYQRNNCNIHSTVDAFFALADVPLGAGYIHIYARPSISQKCKEHGASENSWSIFDTVPIASASNAHLTLTNLSSVGIETIEIGIRLSDGWRWNTSEVHSLGIVQPYDPKKIEEWNESHR